MKPYNLYINLTDTTEDNYFEVELDGEMAFDKVSIDEMPVFRKQWHEVVIKNQPYRYKTNPVNKNKLYDLILDNPPDTEFRIKFVCGGTVIYGYFGQVDCKIDVEENIIKVKPAIIDQYTDFIENYDTKVDLFGEQNLIRNGDFEVWTNNKPDGWGRSPSSIEKDTLLNRDCAKIGRDILLEGFINTTAIVSKDRQIALSFLYAYVGDGELRENLSFEVKLTGSGKTYYLGSNGSWDLVENSIEYRKNALAIPKDKVESFNKFPIISNPMPTDGIISLMFPYSGNAANAIYITDVELYSSWVNYIGIKVDLTTSNLVTKPQESIIDIPSRHYPWFQTDMKASDAPSLFDYFDEDDSPNLSLLSHGYAGMHDGVLRYPDWEEVFENDARSSFYKAELCELTVGIGGEYTNWFTKRVNIKGYAKFAREEIITDDENFEPVAPEGDGWVSVDYPVAGKTKWVRKPYNGAYNQWKLGDYVSAPGRYLNFDYQSLLTSKKEYPTGESSLVIATAVDFRDIIRKIYRSTHNTLLDREVYSAFFWNDSPYLSDIIISSGENYVTREDNVLRSIGCIHTSDLKNLNPMEDDTVLELSWKDFFDDLKLKFPDLVWFVDEDRNLHIEHKKFLNLTQEFIDIRDKDVSYHAYEFNTNEIFSSYEYNEPNSGYRDFKRSKISYDKIVSNKRNKDSKKELTAKYISTDIQFAIENPTNLENGMILIAHNDGVIKYGKGQITGANVPNGDLSISTLLSKYARYEGVWNKGYINDIQVVFPVTKSVRTGDKITIKGTHESNIYLTDLGIAVGETTIDYNNETTEIKPSYRHYDLFIGVGNTLIQI